MVSGIHITKKKRRRQDPDSSRRILVIGGTLFIGRLLVAELLRAGHDVTVLHRKSHHDLGPEVHNLFADRNDAGAVRAALAGQNFDAVFDNVYDFERGTTAAQVEATARGCGDGLQRYVFMSSVAVYGEGLHRSEEDPLAPDSHPDPYVRNKAMTERMLFRLRHETGFPAVTFRPPFVYGPENPYYREAFLWDRILADRPVIVPGDGSRLMQFVYVKDLARACISALENDAATGESFNIGNPFPLTQAELVQALARGAGKSAKLVYVPRELIAQCGGNPMGEPAYFGVYFDLPPITEVVQKAERVLGFRATPFDTGVEQTYEWYLRNRTSRAVDFRFEDRLLRMIE